MYKPNFLNPQLKSGEAAAPPIPGATPAWMTLVAQLVASGASIAAAAIQANSQTGQNVQIPPNYTINYPPNTGQNGNYSGNSNGNYYTPPAKEAPAGISTEMIILIVVGVVLIIGAGVFFFLKSKKTI